MARNGIPPSELDGLTVYELGTVLEGVSDYEFVKEYEHGYRHLELMCTIVNQNLKKSDRFRVEDLVDKEQKLRYKQITEGLGKLTHEEKVRLMSEMI